MKIIQIIIFLLLSFAISAQQHDLWHFGEFTGLDFSSGNPVPINSSIETSEACYTATDANGNLLFYTNGVKVWDANHNLMPNGTGLSGNTSSKCLALQKPNAPNTYYIIYNEAHSSIPNTTINTFYSEIDLSLNGGMGDVVAANKNTLLSPNSGEWLSAAPHGNCIDTWILTHGDETNPTLNAFELTANGISPTPVTSSIGVQFNAGDHCQGEIKPRPGTNQFVFTKPLFSGTIYLFDFDHFTGLASNSNLIHDDPSTRGNGAEFSRDGNVLYIGSLINGKIHQYDLTAANISATRTEIGDLTPGGEVGSLQIAPDDKIYVNYNVFPSGANFLGVINNPNTIGLGCNYIENAVNLGNVTTIYGLPWRYDPTPLSLPPLDLGNDTTLCANGSVLLDGDFQPNTLESYLWSDGSTDSVLTINTPGTYWLERQIGACTVQSDTIIVELEDIALNSNLIDTSLCGTYTLNINQDAGDQFTSVLWDLGDGNTSTNPNLSHQYSAPGMYTINFTGTSLAGCNYSVQNVASIEIFPTYNFEISSQPENPDFNDVIEFDIMSNQTDYDFAWSINGNEYPNNEEVTFEPINESSLEVQLRITDQNGCIYRLTRRIEVENSAFIYVPNAFTPNGSGVNDVFRVSDINDIVENITIFNRWGTPLWSSESALNTWDGTYNGKLVKDGTYVWKIKYRGNRNESKIITGTVTVVK